MTARTTSSRSLPGPRYGFAPSPSPGPSADGRDDPDDAAPEFIPPRERAFLLHCEGLRSPAIGRRLGVPARTVRAWLQQDVAALAQQQRQKRPERLALAVERHLAVAAAAWEAYHRAVDYDELAMAALRSAQGDPDAMRAVPRPSPAAARALAAALAAQREVARLQGLHIYQEDAASEGPQHLLLADDDEIVVRPEEVEAWIAFRDAHPRDTDLAGGERDPAGASAGNAPRPREDAAEMAAAGTEQPGWIGPSGALAPYAPFGVPYQPTPDPAAPYGDPGDDENAAEMAMAEPAVRTFYGGFGAAPAEDDQSPDLELDTAAFAADAEDAAGGDEAGDGEEDPDAFLWDWRERARAGYTVIPLEESARWNTPDPRDPALAAAPGTLGAIPAPAAPAAPDATSPDTSDNNPPTDIGAP